MRLRRVPSLPRTTLLAAGAALLLFGAPAGAEHVPLAEGGLADNTTMADPIALAIEPDASALDDAPAGLADPAVQLASDLLLEQIEQHRRALLMQAYLHRPPTWIQGAATVNLGDFPSLHDPTADAERRLQTLDWVLREQQREAAAARRAAGMGGDDDADVGALPSLLRRLLPSRWVPYLKANRDLVLAAGGSLLLLAWALSAYSRRPGAVRHTPADTAETAATPRPRRRHRRTHHRHHHRSHHHGSVPAQVPATD